MSRPAVFLILLAALVGFVVSQYLPYGNWLALGIASFVGVLCIFWRPKAQNGDRTKPVNIWRRFLAFCIDYQVSLAGSIGLILTMSVCTAWLFTGRLRGPEEVLELLQSTGFNIFVGIGVWVSFLGYFWVHKRLQRSTLGHYVMGYKTIDSSDASDAQRYILGMFAGYVALATVFFWGWFVKEADSFKGEYWWDRVGGTRAVALF